MKRLAMKRLIILAALIASIPLTAQVGRLGNSFPKQGAPTGQEEQDLTRQDTWIGPEYPIHVEIYKTAGKEMTDLHWAHLHASEGDAQTVSLACYMEIWSGLDKTPVNEAELNIQLRYLVHGQPVSDWLDPPYAFDLTYDNAGLPPTDGIHDISVAARGTEEFKYRPRPIYLHLHRSHTVDTRSPIIDRDDDHFELGPSVQYARVSDRSLTGHATSATVVAWHTVPSGTSLYLEPLLPMTELYDNAQMWWQEPVGTVSAGVKFIRGIEAYGSEDLRGLGVYDSDLTAFGSHGHRGLPFRDGVRGYGWSSPYMQGQVDADGGYAFVDVGGPLRYLEPTGTLHTVVGWRVKTDRDPVWILKPMATIRTNMEFIGSFSTGSHADDEGFRQPSDVTIDWASDNGTTVDWYVAGGAENIIWKVVVTKATWTGVASIFAGSTTSGFTNATGTSARFHWPQSIIHDPVCDCLYVADLKNDAIRKITMAGVVTTVAGSPDMGNRLQAAGASECAIEEGHYECYDYTSAKSHAVMTGTGFDVYKPFTIRVTSSGDIVVQEIGFATIRKIVVGTGVASIITTTSSKFQANDWGWVAMDVDRWGNSGPLNGVFFSKSAGNNFDNVTGDNFNQAHAFINLDGSAGELIVNGGLDAYPLGQGPPNTARPPHYPWAMAVDPRGAILMTGFGNHGLARLRKVRVTDLASLDINIAHDGRVLWRHGYVCCGYTYTLQTYFTTPTSYLAKFGQNAHGYLGYADAWDYTAGASDATLINAFGIPATTQGDADVLATLLATIRFYAGAP